MGKEPAVIKDWCDAYWPEDSKYTNGTSPCGSSDLVTCPPCGFVDRLADLGQANYIPDHCEQPTCQFKDGVSVFTVPEPETIELDVRFGKE